MENMIIVPPQLDFQIREKKKNIYLKRKINLYPIRLYLIDNQSFELR